MCKCIYSQSQAFKDSICESTSSIEFICNGKILPAFGASSAAVNRGSEYLSCLMCPLQAGVDRHDCLGLPVSASRLQHVSFSTVGLVPHLVPFVLLGVIPLFKVSIVSSAEELSNVSKCKNTDVRCVENVCAGKTLTKA